MDIGKCADCQRRPGTHGTVNAEGYRVTWRCRPCALAHELAHARFIASKIPQLEAEVAALSPGPEEGTQ